jgi:two-component system chemotaxis sensor kinase CheA
MEEDELLEAFLSDARDSLEEWVRVALKMSEADGVDSYKPIMRCAHNLKGAAGVIGLTGMQTAMHKIEDFVIDLRDQGRGPNAKVVALLLATEKILQDWLAKLKQNPQYVHDTARLENEWQVFLSAPATTGNSPAALAANSYAPEPLKAEKAKAKSEGSIRIPVNKLDRVNQFVGEVCLHHAMLVRATHEGTLNSPGQRQVIDLTSKLLHDLQDAVLALRMIPLESLFQKIERVVKETSSALNRAITIHCSGGDVPLDKTVIEGMLEPMIHLARNAIDHGIESREERVSKGKPEAGRLELSAENAAGSVRLTFVDDGRGIDAEKVYQRALSKRLISPDTPMTDLEKTQLIFMAGLSTAEKVTEYSGRGVGMDVVAESVRRMGGRLEVASQPGKGTRVIINLPTNLSILDALVIKIGSSHYAVPNQDLAEVIDLREYQLHPVNDGRGSVIDLRGRVIPVENLANFLSVQNESAPSAGIVVQHHENRLALAVENVVGQQQIFVRPMPGHLSAIGFYAGSTMLSDGEPTLILNLPEIVRQYFTTHPGAGHDQCHI